MRSQTSLLYVGKVCSHAGVIVGAYTCRAKILVYRALDGLKLLGHEINPTERCDFLIFLFVLLPYLICLVDEISFVFSHH
jgi:hypothetical protein